MNDKHTPTPGPWWIDRDSADRVHARASDKFGYVAICFGPDHATAMANTARIVQCVNTHDDMLKAMRRAVLALAFAAESSPAMRDDYEALSAAISRATSGEQT